MNPKEGSREATAIRLALPRLSTLLQIGYFEENLRGARHESCAAGRQTTAGSRLLSLMKTDRLSALDRAQLQGDTVKWNRPNE